MSYILENIIRIGTYSLLTLFSFIAWILSLMYFLFLNNSNSIDYYTELMNIFFMKIKGHFINFEKLFMSQFLNSKLDIELFKI